MSTEYFERGDLTFGVVGLGYVGLPLAVEVAASGIRTLGFDVVSAVVDGVNQGRSHIQDVPSTAVSNMREEGRLEATAEMARLAECDVISICVPTPLGKTRDPDISYILQAGQAIADTLRPGQLIVLESTTYPGTTREVLLPLFEERGLEVGREFFLCFSPERVDPGNEVWQTRNTPKVLGGITPACVAAGEAAYRRFIDTIVPVSSPEAAELVKILENTFRAVNIALVNETAQIADRLGVDIWEVIEAAATKPFGFMKFTPGPGLGGHCIPVDPHYLSWKMRTLDFRTRFIELASEINAEMPRFVVQKVREALNAGRRSVNGSRILILGVAYKPNIDDVRESPAIDILHELEREGADVRYHDPYVPEVRDQGTIWTGVELNDETMAWADLVVLVTDHRDFDLEWIFDRSPVLVDSRNATGGIANTRGEGQPQRWIVKTGQAQSTGVGGGR
ncbi:MAG: nucleotide sugar dehydrogenase [Gemmatimonadales bacterium]|nr:MAG: nucleotide sugar dehydrogenase [Gemmatimonadales bacterium]